MKILKLINLIILALILNGCASSKLNRTLRQGKVAQSEFKTTIPFDYVNGWIVIKVEIKNKTYNFLLDTGSSNILTKETANELNLKFLDTSEITDAAGITKNHQYGKIESIKIGNIDFQETITAISDLNQNQEIKCAKIDGIIGSNLMSKAVWYFDFQQQKITITDNEKKLNIPNKFEEIKLFIGTSDIPSIIVKVNGKRTLNNTLDLGNAGENILRVDYFQNQKDKEITKYIKGSGKNWGAFGHSKTLKFYNVILDEIQLNHLKVKKVFAVVSNNLDDGNIGLGFLKNYNLVLNWKEKRMKLREVKKRKDYELVRTYGFGTFYKQGGLFVNTINGNSSASKHLKINDQILQINDTDYRNFKEEQYCDFIKNSSTETNTESISITILREGKEFSFILNKNNYFE